MIRPLLARLGTDFEGVIAEMLHIGGIAAEGAARILRSAETEELSGILANADRHTEFLRGSIKTVTVWKINR